MTKGWIKYTVTIETKEAVLIDLVSDVLLNYDAMGIQVKQAVGYLENHPNLFGEISQPLPAEMLKQWPQIVAYFEDKPNYQLIEAGIQHVLGEINWQVDKTIQEEEKWQTNWMTYYRPQRISRFLTIIPFWEEYEAKEDDHVIYLDPGVAFGTGSHDTTQLGAQALELVMQGNEVILDVGTGTGILSFVAASFGAQAVYGYDLDPQAIKAAEDNLEHQRRNARIQTLIDQDSIHFAVNNLLNGITLKADIIVANILPHILVDLFADAYQLLKEGGYLIIGGILREKAAFIEDELKAHAFDIHTTLYKGEWVNYILQKKDED